MMKYLISMGLVSLVLLASMDAKAGEHPAREGRDTTQDAPVVDARATNDHVFFLRLGEGAVVGGDFSAGPSFGLGYRYEYDRLGVEISALNMLLATNEHQDLDDSFGLTGSWVRLAGLYFFEPRANNSAYLNMGLSWSTTGIRSENQGQAYLYKGNGMQGELGVGFEFMRASAVRLFVEANAALPFYTLSPEANPSYSPTGDLIDEGIIDDSIYAPSFTISLGVGFGNSDREAPRAD